MSPSPWVAGSKGVTCHRFRDLGSSGPTWVAHSPSLIKPHDVLAASALHSRGASHSRAAQISFINSISALKPHYAAFCLHTKHLQGGRSCLCTGCFRQEKFLPMCFARILTHRGGGNPRKIKLPVFFPFPSLQNTKTPVPVHLSP